MVLLSAEPNSEFFLQDEEGTFLTVPVVVLETAENSDEVESVSRKPMDSSELRRELYSLKEENQALQGCVASLNDVCKTRKFIFVSCGEQIAGVLLSTML